MQKQSYPRKKEKGASGIPETALPFSYDRFACPALPPGIQTDFITIPANFTVKEAIAIIQSRQKKTAVIHGSSNNSMMYYVFGSSQIHKIIMNHDPNELVADVLELDKKACTQVISMALALKRLRSGKTDPQVAVLVDDGKVLGYVEPGKCSGEMGDVDECRSFDKSDPEGEMLKEFKLKTEKIDRLHIDKGKMPSSITKTIGRRGTVQSEKHGGRDRSSGNRIPASVISERGNTPKKSRTARTGTLETARLSPADERPVTANSPSPCCFYAQMPEEVVAGNICQVQTTISRGEIEQAAGAASQQGRTTLPEAPDQKITVRLVPKRNFDVIGDSRADVHVPLSGEPAVQLFFDVKPGACGPGELWVAFCQGPVSLVTLKLKPQVVASQTASGTEPLEVQTTAAPHSGIPERMNTMWVYSGENNGTARYRYWLWLDDLGVDEQYESPEFRGNLTAVLKPYMDLFDQVETQDPMEFDQLQIQLRSIGARLFQTLFPKELQSVFWEKRNEIRHLKLYCEEPFIPWEILHICEPGKRLPEQTLFLGQMGLVRWLHGHSAPTRLHIRPGRAWYLTPTYPGNELQSAQQEGTLLQNLFGAQPVLPATRPEVTKLLRNQGPFDLFHFAGHGDASEEQITDCRILLEPAGESTNIKLRDLTPDIVSGLCQLKAEDGSRPIVVLNSCRAGKIGYRITGLGGFAQAFLEREAGVFISAQWMVGDQPALTFIKAFYEALHTGRTVAEAVNEGREKACRLGDATYLAYVVYADPFAHLVQ